MGISESKKKANDKLRKRILDAAEDIIVKEGVQNVTMRRIASCVDYAPTVLYRLFASKNDLMDHLIARGYEGVRQRYQLVLDREDFQPDQTLFGIFQVYTDYALAHPNHYRMWFDTGHIRLESGELIMSHGRLEFTVFQTWLDCIASCCRAGQLSGHDPLEVFQVLWSRLHGLISLRLQNPEFSWLPLEEHLAQVLDLGPVGDS